MKYAAREQGTKRVPVTYSLSPTARERLRAMAAEADTSISAILENLIEQSADRQRDPKGSAA